MGIINDVKSGVDLTHPKPTAGYVIACVFALAVLGVAYWLYQKAKNTVSPVTAKVTTTAANSGIFGNGS